MTPQHDEISNDFLPLIIGGLVFSILLAFAIVALSQTHIAPDREPCPLNVQCLIDINGTLVKESE